MCRHSYFAIQINEKGREFVNEISGELHLLTGVQQWITSAYHPHSSGLVENKTTIQNSLVMVLEENPLKWPSITEGVIFAHRVSKQSSTMYSPFKLLYNRGSVLPNSKLLGTASKNHLKKWKPQDCPCRLYKVYINPFLGVTIAKRFYCLLLFYFSFVQKTHINSRNDVSFFYA